MKDCVFCKISPKKTSEGVVYENSKILAFLDLHPANPGHTLVIPKNHYETIDEIPDSLLAEMSKVIKEVSIAVVKATGAEGFNIAQNNGKVAGQAVFHVHFHIIPRFKDDGLLGGFHVKKPFELDEKYKYEDGEAKDVMKKIRRALMKS